MANGMPGEPGVQAKQRRKQTYTDQHGRQWWANIELKTGHPTGGPIQPMFTAPWYPDPQHVHILPDEAGKPWAVEIKYGDQIQALEQAHRERAAAILKKGIELHGQEFNPDKPSMAVLHFVGPAPKPVEPVYAALQMNGWILGLRDFNPDSTADVRLQRILAPVEAKVKSVGGEWGDEPEAVEAEAEESAPRQRGRSRKVAAEG